MLSAVSPRRMSKRDIIEAVIWLSEQLLGTGKKLFLYLTAPANFSNQPADFHGQLMACPSWNVLDRRGVKGLSHVKY